MTSASLPGAIRTASSGTGNPGEVQLAPPAHRDRFPVPEGGRVDAARDEALDGLERRWGRFPGDGHVGDLAIRPDQVGGADDAVHRLAFRDARALPPARLAHRV